MLNVIILAGIFLAILASEIPGMVKNKEWRELAVFGGMMLIAMTLSFAAALDIPLPNPNKALGMIFDPVTAVIHRLLS